MAKGDLFLKLEGERAGPIRGEAHDAVHGQEIDITSWSWSMDYPDELRSGGRTGRASLRSLCVTKSTDASSTALMSAMYTNEKLKKAVLTVRKAGGAAPIDYFVVTLKDAYITRFDIESKESPAPGLVERLELRFAGIDITYAAQDAKGQKQGGSSFTAQVSSA